MPHKPVAPVAALYTWQLPALAWLAGGLAVHYGTPALCLPLVLVWVDKRCRRLSFVLCLAIAFALGFAYTKVHIPLQPQSPPAWAQGQDKKHPTRCVGTVAAVQALPNGRLRMLLHSVLPETPLPLLPPEYTPPQVRWTWEEPLWRPLVGQRISFALPWRSTAGLRNAFVPHFGYTWASQGYFWQVWSKGDKGQPRLLEAAAPQAALREHIVQRVLAALYEYSQPAQGTLTQGQAFVPALLFGDRSLLSQESISLLSSAALIHSIALSGQHLGISLGIALALAWLAAWCFPRAYLTMPRRTLALGFALPLAAAYVWLGDAPPSLVRAACMLLLLAVLLYKKALVTAVDIVLGTAFVLSLASPLLLISPGLQLSLLAVLCLALCLPALRLAHQALRARGLPCPRLTLPLIDTALCSACISCALLPLCLWYFHNAGWWFLLNVLWLPVLAVWVMPLLFGGLVLVLLGSFPLLASLHTAGGWLFALAVIPCQWLMDGLTWLEAQGWLTNPALWIGHWTWWAGYWLVLLAFCLRAARPCLPPAGKRLLLAGGFFLLLGLGTACAPFFSENLTLRVLDVGQGQAVLLELPQGQRILIDGGNASPRFDMGKAVLMPRLCANRWPQLSALVASHPDIDHLGGLLWLGQNFAIDQVWHNGDMPQQEQALAWAAVLQSHPSRCLVAGQRLVLDAERDIVLEVLHPQATMPEATAQPIQVQNNAAPAQAQKLIHTDRQEPAQAVHKPAPAAKQAKESTGNTAARAANNDNERSLVLRLTWQGKGLVLLTGDIEKRSMRQLASSAVPLHATVLLAPHHGSRSSLSKPFYAAVQPSVVLASCGKNNRFGYPAPALLHFLAQKNIPLLSTASQGEIAITWRSTGAWTMQTQEQFWQAQDTEAAWFLGEGE